MLPSLWEESQARLGWASLLINYIFKLEVEGKGIRELAWFCLSRKKLWKSYKNQCIPL